MQKHKEYKDTKANRTKYERGLIGGGYRIYEFEPETYEEYVKRNRTFWISTTMLLGLPSILFLWFSWYIPVCVCLFLWFWLWLYSEGWKGIRSEEKNSNP